MGDRRPLILFPNYVDATFYTVGFSGGSWETALPLSNLRDRYLANVARSTGTGLASTQFEIDLGAKRAVKGLCIPVHNLSRLSTVRALAGASSGFAAGEAVADTGATDVWRRVYPRGTLPYGHESWWDGRLTEEDAQGYPMPWIHVFQTQVVARYWRFEIADTANGAGYVQLARLMIAPGWEVSQGGNRSSSEMWETATGVGESLGGARFYDRRPARRVVQISFDHLPRDEVMGRGFELARGAGIDRQAVYVGDRSDKHLHRLTFLATLAVSPRFGFAGHATRSMSAELSEVVA